eukprot:1620065-Pleurochrysis_carterae.AAC.1
MLAKGSRMLGGNSGCFGVERDSIIVVLGHPKLGALWTHALASAPGSAFDLYPSEADLTESLGAEYK